MKYGKPTHTSIVFQFPRRGDRSRRAFTLVELLVVVAIIALLIGILLPAVNRARDVAQATVCLTRLRALAEMASFYTIDHRGSFPYAYYWTDTEEIHWDYRKDYTNGFQNPIVTPGALWQQVDGGEVQQCPVFEGNANSPGDPHTGYNYNSSYIGGYRDFGASRFVPSAKTGHVKRTSETALFGDGEYADGANKHMRAPVANPHDEHFVGRHAGTQGYRHLGRTNVAWVDGHAAPIDDRHTETDGDVDAGAVAEGTGFLSKDNELYDLD